MLRRYLTATLISLISCTISLKDVGGQSAELYLKLNHTGVVNSLAYNPDGTLVATAGADNTVKVWSASSGELLRTLSHHQADIFAVAFSPNGRWLASAGYDRAVVVWDVEKGEVVRVFKNHRQPVTDVAFTIDGNRLVTCSRDSTIAVWDLRTGALGQTLFAHRGRVNAIACHPDGQILASVGSDKMVNVWRIATGDLLRSLGGHVRAVTSLGFSPDGHLLATGSADGSARIWRVDTWQVLHVLQGEGQVSAVGFSPDSKLFMAAGEDGFIRTWNVKTWQLRDRIKAHSARVKDLAFSPDGSKIVSSGADGLVAFLSLNPPELVRQVEAQSRDILSVAIGGDDDVVVSAEHDGTFKVWDLRSGRQTAAIPAHDGPVWSVDFHANGRFLVTAGGDGSAKVWEFGSRIPVQTLRGHVGPVYSAVFSPDGRKVATAGHDKTVRVWDRYSGRLLLTLVGHLARVWAVEYSPNGGLLASSSDDYSARIWDSSSGQLLRTLPGHAALVRSISFSPDGRWLATASSDKTIMVWEVRTGSLLRTLSGHVSSVKAVRFSPDGRILASGGFDNVIKLWDAQTWQPVDDLAGHANDINALAFRSDSRGLVSCSPDGTIKLWAFSAGLRAMTFVNLPGGEWLSVAPGGLFYAGSEHAEQYAGVRFDQSLHAISPLLEHKEELKQADLRALPVDEPEIRSAPATGKAIHPTYFLLAGLVIGALVVASGGAFMARRRSASDNRIHQFFSQAGYRPIKTGSEQMFELRPDNSQTPGFVIAWQNGAAALENKLSHMVRKSSKKLKSDPKLYVVHDEARALAEEMQGFLDRLQCRAIPVSTTLLNRSLASNNCREVLQTIERSYLDCANPYDCPNPLQDPNRFFGRNELLDRLPAALRLGQHVGLFGLNKVGRSSLAHQIRHRYAEAPSVLIECGKVSPEKEFYFLEIINQLQRHLAAAGIPNVPHARSILKARGFRQALLSLFEAWQMAGSGKPFLIILDELHNFGDKGKLGEEQESLQTYASLLREFEALAISHKCLSLLLTANRREEVWPDSLGEKGPLFQNMHIEHLGFLAPDDSRNMVQSLGVWAGIHWEASAANHVFLVCGGHPLVTRLFASHVCERGAIRRIEFPHVEETAEAVRADIRNHDIGHYFEHEVWPFLAGEEKELLRMISMRGRQGLLQRYVPPTLLGALPSLENFGLVADDLGRLSLMPRLFDDWVAATLP
ncbi:MAG: hypothetical protein ACE5IY_12345 [bacterium]